MNEINLIGLSGQLQNGKDTVADLIIKITGNQSPPFNDGIMDGSNWKTKRFAGVLKEMTALLIGCEIQQLEDNVFKNTPLNEEWRRWYFIEDCNSDKTNEIRCSNFYSSYDDAMNSIEIGYLWLDKTFLRSEILTPRLILQLLGTEGGRDVIHPNIWVNATLGKLKKSDFTIITDCRFPNEVDGIKKLNGIVVRVIRPSIISTSTHISETSLNDYKDWSYIIINDGTIEELEEKVRKMLNYFKIIS